MQSEINDTLKSRVKEALNYDDSFIGAYCTSFLLYNWEMFVHLYYQNGVTAKISSVYEVINRSHASGWWIPAISGAIYLFGFPFLKIFHNAFKVFVKKIELYILKDLDLFSEIERLKIELRDTKDSVSKEKENLTLQNTKLKSEIHSFKMNRGQLEKDHTQIIDSLFILYNDSFNSYKQNAHTRDLLNLEVPKMVSILTNMNIHLNIDHNRNVKLISDKVLAMYHRGYPINNIHSNTLLNLGINTLNLDQTSSPHETPAPRDAGHGSRPTSTTNPIKDSSD